MKLGAQLTDEEVSDMVRVIRDAGGGVCLGDEDYGYDDNEALSVCSVCFRQAEESCE